MVWHKAKGEYIGNGANIKIYFTKEIVVILLFIKNGLITNRPVVGMVEAIGLKWGAVICHMYCLKTLRVLETLRV